LSARRFEVPGEVGVAPCSDFLGRGAWVRRAGPCGGHSLSCWSPPAGISWERGQRASDQPKLDTRPGAHLLHAQGQAAGVRVCAAVRALMPRPAYRPGSRSGFTRTGFGTPHAAELACEGTPMNHTTDDRCQTVRRHAHECKAGWRRGRL